jgi:hypothetical protein
MVKLLQTLQRQQIANRNWRNGSIVTDKHSPRDFRFAPNCRHIAALHLATLRADFVAEVI